MVRIFAMAYRYTVRAWRRSLINIVTMALASGVMIFYVALMQGLLAQAEQQAIALELAHVQIHAADYRTDPDLYRFMPDADAIVAQLEAQSLFASARLYATALGASAKTSSGIQLQGIDIAQEQMVTELSRHLQQGAWLDASKPKQVVVGNQLAESLDIGLGEELIVLGQTYDGAMANELFIVRGILKSVGRELDRTTVLLSQQSFRNLFSFPAGAHEIAIRDPQRGRSLTALKQLVENIDPVNEVATWRELRPLVANLLDTSRGGIYILLIISYIAVAMVIMNAMLMSVFERIREFGVLKALGLSPIQLLNLVFVESLIQITFAAILGAVVFIPITLYFARTGIDLTAFSEGFDWGGVTMSPVWHPSLTPSAIASPVMMLYLMGLVSILYPAVKAASIIPVKAIYMRN